MSRLPYIIAILSHTISYAQSLDNLYPDKITFLKTDFDSVFVANYNTAGSQTICAEIWARKAQNNDLVLSESEKASLSLCDEFGGNPWSKPFTGCSWYCGGIIDSSESSNTEFDEFLGDFDYGKFWVSETGQALPYFKINFNRESARVTQIIIANGAVKSSDLYHFYSRAKKIKLYLDDKALAILNLSDTKDLQTFTLKPLGNKLRKNGTADRKSKHWSLTFEIIETYPGNTDQVAISEINFEGEHE